MMRRVSSRPRLASDADGAFRDVTVEVDERSDELLNNSCGYCDDGGLPSYGLCYDAMRTLSDTGGGYSAVARADRSSTTMDAEFGSSDDVSDDQSCCDTMPRRIPSLLDLQDSFQKKDALSILSDNNVVPPLEEAMKDRKPEAVTSPSTKRKRPSHYFHMIPRSSFGSLPGSSSLLANNRLQLYNIVHHGPLTANQGPLLSTPKVAPFAKERPLRLLDLPDDGLLSVASYLPLQDIRPLAATCRPVRATLVASPGALHGIWMDSMARKFPGVFHRVINPARFAKGDEGIAARGGIDNGLSRPRASLFSGGVAEEIATATPQCIEACLSLREVALLDGYRMPVCGLPDGVAFGGKVNLPLLTALLPSRHPRAIDPSTLHDTVGHQTFRSYALAVPIDDRALFPQEDEEVVDRQGNKDKLHATTLPALAENTIAGGVVIVPVVQFVGNVGTGDRCIRSDQPFPPNCREFPCSCESSSASFGGSLLSWVKKRSRKARRNKSSHRRMNDSSSIISGRYGYGPLLMHPNSPSRIRLPSSSLTPSQHSPLQRFVSSLSYRCNSPPYSSMGDSAHSSNASSDGSEGRFIDNGPNEYRMTRTNKLTSKHKCSLGRLHQRGLELMCADCDGLRPFVIPTVISDTRGIGDSKAKGSLVVDVTPRIVAYFEVTIVAVSGESRPNGNNMDRPVTSHRQNLDEPLRRNNQWRAPHFLFLPAGIPPAALETDGPRGAEPPPVPRRIPHPPLLHRMGHRHRHECVAVGLSTRRFNPSSKMPGWDCESFGYHGDDGGLFHGKGEMLRQYGPSFGPGDAVGCGLEYDTQSVFFVKNGVFLGYAFDEEDVGADILEEGLYPTVGVDTECPVFVNFGERPFVFDLRRFTGSSGSAEVDRD